MARAPVPEFIDPVFTKTSQKRSFTVIENERFGLVLAKTGSINSGTGPNLQVAQLSLKRERGACFVLLWIY
jgi:hypothetical protein